MTIWEELEKLEDIGNECGSTARKAIARGRALEKVAEAAREFVQASLDSSAPFPLGYDGVEKTIRALDAIGGSE